MELINIQGNNYLYEPRTRFISLVPDGLCKNLTNPYADSCYQRKIQYLQSYGLITFDSESHTLLRDLTIQDIQTAILNTHQLVFEVTDKCNLNCYYCGYGSLYSNHDVREDKDMPFEYFKAVYDYFREQWNTSWKKGFTTLYISFYGGEPLCNFSFIQKAVNYTKIYPIEGKHIRFSMTTNAVLLDRYLDFLKENEFDLLISIDGNKHNHSYRIFRNGNNSYEKVVENIFLLKDTYPTYFKNRIKFNSVLHDRNSIIEADQNIYSLFEKHPSVSELNPFGINQSERNEFLGIFKSKEKSYRELSQKEQEEYIHHSPQLRSFSKWVFLNLMTTYSTSLSTVLQQTNFIDKNIEKSDLPTRTCIPFERKMYVTVNGKIFPCERIGHELDFGKIQNGKLVINFDSIIKFYNAAFAKYHKLCGKCAKKDFCNVCVTTDTRVSERCADRNLDNLKELIEYFTSKPESINKIIKTVSMI